jgi:hypothetical protein
VLFGQFIENADMIGLTDRSQVEARIRLFVEVGRWEGRKHDFGGRKRCS